MSYGLAIFLVAALDAMVIAAVIHVCVVPFRLDRRHASSSQWLFAAELGEPTECDAPRGKPPELEPGLAA